MHWSRGQKVKGQGHTVTKTVTVARLLVTRAATAVCCCCRRGSACRYDCLCFLVFMLCWVIESLGGQSIVKPSVTCSWIEYCCDGRYKSLCEATWPNYRGDGSPRDAVELICRQLDYQQDDYRLGRCPCWPVIPSSPSSSSSSHLSLSVV